MIYRSALLFLQYNASFAKKFEERMRKSDKKLDKDIRKALTGICENELKTIDGFEWVTHVVNYANFPTSLKVVCVFTTNVELNQFLNSNHAKRVGAGIYQALSDLKIKLPPLNKLVVFDSEENCERDNRGNWKARLG